MGFWGKRYVCLLFFFFLLIVQINAQSLERQIGDSLTVIANEYSYIGRVTGIKIIVDASNKIVRVNAPDKLSYIPFRPENIVRINRALGGILNTRYKGYKIICVTNGLAIEALIPNYYRTGNKDLSRNFDIETSIPLVTKLSQPYTLTNGLQGRHIALWHSHGWYYAQDRARWEWQRARIHQTVEDIYSLSYVLPYVVPMLENAGANVFLPRERDLQTNEVIVDNDDKHSDSRYKEHKHWNEEPNGFANPKESYVFGENPFRMGTYVKKKTVDETGDAGWVEWRPKIPEAGKYAVYVSYKTLPNSTNDAQYTVFHKAGETKFNINQMMGGGTWIYLGTFDFEEGLHSDQKVELSSYSKTKDKIVTADAVKFGGGMGNIARSPIDTIFCVDSSKPAYEPEVSRYPRWVEGARYWMQWAGVPDSVYSRTKGTNDYRDDFQSRGFWVNWLSGGSVVAPREKGLKIPLDMSLALHTDAGVTKNDSIIGTLGIFSVANTQKTVYYKNGISRWAARDLTDIVQTQIVNDVQAQFNSKWTRRGLWNKSYSESREPEIPTLMLELLSHQNFADMHYGLDPRFQFTVSRAIYKGILRYLATANGFDYVVQPLPVRNMNCSFVGDELELKWLPSTDELEATAGPEKYIVYIRIDDGAFDNGTLVVENKATIVIEEGKIYSFKVTAVNKGGESFPSEILSACRAKKSKGEVLIVNGFDRISAPASFEIDSTYAGFLPNVDFGVPYICNVNFTGSQYEFDRNVPYVGNDAPGFGASHGSNETEIIAGNSFDYPFVHGQAIKAAGYSFVSCSSSSVQANEVDLSAYKTVDLILGKQKQINMNGQAMFTLLPPELQTAIRSFCEKGGNLLLSGSYIGSELTRSSSDKDFLENVLKCKFITGRGTATGDVRVVDSPYPQFVKNTMSYYGFPNAMSYSVEAPDVIESSTPKAYTICRYNENNKSAGVAYAGDYKVCTFGFPFETIIDVSKRHELMKNVLTFFGSYNE